MGKMLDKCLEFTIKHQGPPDYCVGSVWRSVCRVFPIFVFLFLFATGLAIIPSPIGDRIQGFINLIITGHYYVSPEVGGLVGDIIWGLIVALPISIWLGIRQYRGKTPLNEPIHKKILNEIETKKYLWLPTPEEVEAGIVSFEEYEQRLLGSREIEKRGISFRILSTTELPPQDRSFILGNASGITPEKSPEKTPPEPEPLSALRQSLSETIVSPNDELR